MKWIKASERLPELKKYVYLKIKETPAVGHFDNKMAGIACLAGFWGGYTEDTFDKIEWLDETPREEWISEAICDFVFEVAKFKAWKHQPYSAILLEVRLWLSESKYWQNKLPARTQ